MSILKVITKTILVIIILTTFIFMGVLLGVEFSSVPRYQEEQGGVVEKYTPALDYEEMIIGVVEKSIPSVVSIVSYEVGVEQGRGTGFIISEDGFILTNRHIVHQDSAEYKVFLSTGESFLAEVIAKDPVQDLAVIKIETEDLPVLEIGNSDNIRIGQTAIAIGNALGELENTVSVGVISGTGREIWATGAESTELLSDVIQTDAAINFGNSGGPLLNIKGEVIGINTAIATYAEGIGFAIPVNKAQRAIKQAIEKGEIIYPFLGVRYLMIDEEVKQEKNLSVDYGAVVVSGGRGYPAVSPDSSAEEAGIKEGDVILEINQEKINEKNHLAEAINRHEPEDEITIKILRNETEIELKATLGELK
jgi:serine protease Do